MRSQQTPTIQALATETRSGTPTPRTGFSIRCVRVTSPPLTDRAKQSQAEPSHGHLPRGTAAKAAQRRSIQGGRQCRHTTPVLQLPAGLFQLSTAPIPVTLMNGPLQKHVQPVPLSWQAVCSNASLWVSRSQSISATLHQLSVHANLWHTTPTLATQPARHVFAHMPLR
jgi:hypothetical protein